MKLVKIYETKVRDHSDVKQSWITCHGYATSRREFIDLYGGGDTAPVDVTANYFVSDRERDAWHLLDSSPDRLFSDLTKCGWGNVEADYIAELLRAALEAQNR